MSDMVYSSSQAARLAELSEGSLRNYSPGGRFGKHYAPFFSAGAAPGPGQPRQFSERDLVLLRYIRQRTSAGIPHERIADEITAGALDDFDWRPPEETAQQARKARQGRQEGQEEAQQSQAALVAVEAIARQLAAVMTAELERSRAEVAELQAQLRDVSERAAAAEREAELRSQEAEELRAELAQRRKGLLRRMFGR